MPESQERYQDFEIEIDAGTGRDYPVRVWRSPAGEAEGVLHFPFSELELKLKLTELEKALAASGQKRRQAFTKEEEKVHEFGQALYQALFTGDIRVRYEASLIKVGQLDQGLRIKLRFKAPEMAYLPWEFMYDPNQGEYLCLSADTPLIRYIPLPRPPQSLQVQLPLSVLGMVANPKDYEPLNVEKEQHLLEQALMPLTSRGILELKWLEGESWRDLQGAMRRGPWHIFHFIGHGGFDQKNDQGLLILTGDDGNGDPINATNLGRLLEGHKSLRLVVLNACEGALGSELDIFSSTSSILVRRGLPAVLAMQYPITDRAALEFSRAFYEAIADNLPVDTAVTEARKAIVLEIDNTVEWGVPVLHTRAPDGILFDLHTPVLGKPVPPKKEPAQPETPKGEVVRSAEPEASLVNLRLEPSQTDAITGQPVDWQILVENKSEQPVKGLTLLFEGAILEQGFELKARESKPISHSTTYNKHGTHPVTVRLLGRGIDMTRAGAAQVTNPPDFSLWLVPDRELAQPGQEITWQITVFNEGGLPLEQVMVSRERSLLAEPFDLPTGHSHNLTYKRSYSQPGAPQEAIEATASTARGAFLKRQAQGALKVGYPFEPQMVTIPAGEFLMGSTPEQAAQAVQDGADKKWVEVEQPQHKVSLSDYAIGRYPVTNREYQSFVEDAGYKPPAGWSGNKFPEGKGDHPVVNVSWKDAKTYCLWLREKTGKPYRLPTEAEWEKAARGTDGLVYPWGDVWDPAKCNTREGGPGTTTPVGQYSPQGNSPYICADMAGNVWEWCLDWFDESIYKTRAKKVVQDPIGPPKGEMRVVRGGSWRDDRSDARCATRIRSDPDDFDMLLGFRVVLSPIHEFDS